LCYAISFGIFNNISGASCRSEKEKLQQEIEALEAKVKK
jgi:BMFP domain-containing protein YqiC